MHRLTRAVTKEAAALEFRQFQFPEDRERLAAIRVCALEQIADDTPSMSGRHRDRIGDANPARSGPGWVVHGDPDFGETLWRRWSPDQMALEDSMAPLLTELTPQQREVIHLLFWGRLTYRQTAAVMHVYGNAVQGLERRALASLRRAITTRYLTEAAA